MYTEVTDDLSTPFDIRILHTPRQPLRHAKCIEFLDFYMSYKMNYYIHHS